MPRTPRPPRLPRPAAETLEERWTLEAQTARNLEGLAAERAGDLATAVSLYERNAAEGFPGDWPYGRLVALYEKQGALDQAERVLARAIDVFQTSRTRTPQARRTMVLTFRKRLAMVRQKRKAEARAAAKVVASLT